MFFLTGLSPRRLPHSAFGRSRSISPMPAPCGSRMVQSPASPAPPPCRRAIAALMRLFIAGSEGVLIAEFDRDYCEIRRNDGTVERLDIPAGDWIYRCDGPVNALVDLALEAAAEISRPAVSAPKPRRPSPPCSPPPVPVDAAAGSIAARVDGRGGELGLSSRHRLRAACPRGRPAEYRRRHAEIWPEMAAARKASGIVHYDIFLHEDGLRVFGHSCDDVASSHTHRRARFHAMAAVYVGRPGNGRRQADAQADRTRVSSHRMRQPLYAKKFSRDGYPCIREETNNDTNC